MTGKDLKKFRQKMKMTQVEFGTELGFANPQIQMSQFENGKRPITRRMIASIEKWKKSEKIAIEAL